MPSSDRDSPVIRFISNVSLSYQLWINEAIEVLLSKVRYFWIGYGGCKLQSLNNLVQLPCRRKLSIRAIPGPRPRRIDCPDEAFANLRNFAKSNVMQYRF